MTDMMIEAMLAPTREAIERIEAENRSITFRLTITEAQRVLQQSPAFRHMVEKLAELRTNEVRQLVEKRMDSYELGLRQGLLRAIAELRPENPPSDEQIAKWKQTLEDNRQRLVDLYRTLTMAGGVAPVGQ